MGNRIVNKFGVSEECNDGGNVATMTAPQTTNTTNAVGQTNTANPVNGLWNNLGVSGKLICCGALIGLICCFLPAMSITADIFGVKSSVTLNVFTSIFGKLCFLCYAGALTFGLLACRPNNAQCRTFCWAACGCAVAACLSAIGVFFDVASAANTAIPVEARLSITTSYGVGCFLNMIAAAVVCFGACWKARQENCF